MTVCVALLFAVLLAGGDSAGIQQHKVTTELKTENRPPGIRGSISSNQNTSEKINLPVIPAAFPSEPKRRGAEGAGENGVVRRELEALKNCPEHLC